jgi:hypothetical protein
MHIIQEEPMSIHTKSMKCTVAAVALAAAALSATPALPDPANIKSMSFNTEGANTTIHVISTDGQKWDKLKSGNVQFWGHMKLDTRWPGYVGEVGVALGVCGAQQCATFPMIWSDLANTRDYTHQQNFTFSTSKIPVSEGGIAVVPYGDQILAKCNQHLQPDGPTKSYSFSQKFNATFVAETDKILNMKNVLTEANSGEWPFDVTYATHSKRGEFDVQVVCDPVMKPPTDDLAHDHGDFDVKNVKLFLTTYQTLQPGSNPGTACPALKVTSRAQANQAGAVSMRIWRRKNGGPITSEFKQAWASFDAAKNGYFATYESWEDVGATSYFQFKTEIVENDPFAPFDGWKDITVHCTSPGGGGLTTVPKDNDPLFPPPQAKWRGEVIVADSAGHDKSCPRKGQVFFEVTRQAPGDFDYRISCSNGAFFTGTATGYDQGSGVFEAYGAHDLSITKTRSIQCTLQELQPAPVTVAVDKQDFTCNNPAIVPDADDVTTVPRPNPAKPVFPAIIVTPEPKCDRGEKLIRGRCIGKPDVSILCKPGFDLVGRKCIRKPVIVAACKRDQIRVNSKCVKKPGVSIHCRSGYKQVGKKCVKKPEIVQVCKRNEQRVNGKCVKKPVVSILCSKGFKLVDKKCLRIPTLTKNCARGEKLVRGNCVGKPDRAQVKTFIVPKRNKASAFRQLELPKRRRKLHRQK